MTFPLFLRALAVLALIVLAEVVNGTFRALVVAPLLGDFTARQIGVLTGSMLIGAVAWACSPWLAARTRGAQWCVGALWMVLMLAFEVAVGRWLAGASWERIASDYNLAQGGLLGLGMAWLGCAPWAAARLRPQAPA